MTWPTSIIIDTVFIPIYVIVGGFALANCIKHGRRRSLGFISLLIFAIVRIIGNILIVVEYNQNYTSITTTVWGYILQSIGYSFLYSSSLAFYLRAEQSTEKRDSVLLAKLPRFLHLANVVALVLVIVGQSNVSYTDANGNFISPHLPVEAKVGVILYIVITVVLLGLVLFGMCDMPTREVRILFTTLIVGLPLMLVRAAYSTYANLSNTTLMPKSIWAKFVLQYLTELAVIIAYTLMGFLIPKLVKTSSYEDRLDVENGQNCHSESLGSPNTQSATPVYSKSEQSA